MSPDSLTPAAQPSTRSEILSPTAPSVLRVESAPDPIQKIGSVRITPQARRYALWELARRAGVSPEVFATWAIRQDSKGTVLEVFPNTGKQILFPNAGPELLRKIAANQASTVRREWLYDPPAELKKIIPDFVVPFADGSQPNSALFVATSRDRIECSVDLLLAVLLTLSRWEEAIATEHDAHGRFSAKQSVAFKDGFLERPIVDEYGLAFEQAVKFLNPAWRPAEKKLRAKISHDADHIGIPFQGKNILRQIARLDPQNTWRELWGWLPDCDPADLCAVREIVSLTREHKLDSAVYWMGSPPSPRDSGYDPRHRKVRKVIDWLRGHGVESGVQPGYSTYRSPERLRREMNVLRQVLGDGPLGGRQHYLRWCVDTWIHWEMCGLAYDSTLSYADHIGFRCGTCIPYQPWLLSLNRAADLLEVPLLVMDHTLREYMHLSEEQSVESVRRCVDRCAAVGGVFTMVWHNNTLLEPNYRRLYMRLLRILQGAQPFDWREERWPTFDSIARKAACASGS